MSTQLTQQAKEESSSQSESETTEVEEQRQEVTRNATADEETYHLKVFRYDPEIEGKKEPRFDDFYVPYHQGMTVLDSLIYARDTYDSSLTFRHSCRQAICGSDAMFVNGSQRLCCKTQLSDLEEPVRIEPLPHQDVIKDLVVNMEHFYDQMEAIEPYFQTEDLPDGEFDEQRQSRENREKIKMYRFAMDDREGDEMKQRRLEIIEQEHGVWRCQTQFSCTEVCPKDIPLTEHIQELKREAVKNNLKFW